jgi:hypothetical protein
VSFSTTGVLARLVVARRGFCVISSPLFLLNFLLAMISFCYILSMRGAVAAT